MKLSSPLPIILCPVCREALGGALGDTVNCPCCTRTFESSPGFIRMNPAPYYWGEIPKDAMEKVLADSRNHGWQEAVRLLLGGRRWENGFNNICGPCRADWLPEMPFDESCRVLDIASGWGQISFLLSDWYRDVISLEGVPQRAEFQRLRREQEGRDNLTIVNTDVTSLPFAPRSFDLVVMNGIVEWLGLSDLTCDPRDVQVRVLQQVAGLLRPGGCLYIGIENRFSYTSIRGAMDHSGLRYTNLMPRWMANLAVRWCQPHNPWSAHGASAYRTYTYSPRGYGSLLKAAGLSDVTVKWVLPGYNDPLDCADMAHADLLEWYWRSWPFRRHAGLKRQVAKQLCRSRLYPLLMPHVSVHARASGQTIPSVLERTCEQLSEHGIVLDPSRCVRRSSRARPSPYSYIQYCGFERGKRDPSVMLKIPRSQSAMKHLNREASVFQEIGYRLPALSRQRNARYFDVGGVPVLCEPYFPGVAFRSHLLRYESHTRVLNWLIGLRLTAASGRDNVCGAQRCRELLATVGQLPGLRRQTLQFLDDLLERLPRNGTLSHTAVACHGDLNSENVLITGDDMYVTDWEFASNDASMAFDLWHFLSSSAMRVDADGTILDEQDPRLLTAALVGRTPYSPIMFRAARDFMTRTEASVDMMLAGFLEAVLCRVVRDAKYFPDSSRSVYWRFLDCAARDGLDICGPIAAAMADGQAAPVVS